MARIEVNVHADVGDISVQGFAADRGLGRPFWILRVGEISIFLSESKVVDALQRALDEIRAGMETAALPKLRHAGMVAPA